MRRILCIGHDTATTAALDELLRQRGFELRVASTAEAGLRVAAAWGPHAVVMNLVLRDLPASELFRRLQQLDPEHDRPIVILTDVDDETHRVVCFELGADDYIAKPFVPRELVLRLVAVLRRYDRRGAVANAPLARIRVDLSAHRVTVDADEVALSATEFRVLAALGAAVGRVLDREELTREIWGEGASVSPRTLDTHVMRVRRKLGPAGECVQTVRGVGYRVSSAKTVR